MGEGIIIQARLTSNRFPNKVLAPLLGKPVLQWVIESVEKTKIPYCIAIPDSLSDSGIESWLQEYCMRRNKPITLYKGVKEDLINRFVVANYSMNFNPIIRICGDSPFVAPEDIKLALSIYNERKYFTQLNHVQVFGVDELKYEDDHDPFINSRQHAGTRGMAHTVDYPEDIKKITREWNDNSPTMKGRKKLWM